MVGKSKAGRAGFTLIELLVVVAVIAILAGLILASLTRAKGSVYRTTCKNNVRQLALSLSMYVDDFGAYPMDLVGPPEWAGKLANYSAGQTTNLGFKCPSTFGETQVMSDGYRIRFARRYGYNGWGYLPNGQGFPHGLGGKVVSSSPLQVVPVRAAEVRVPSEMIALGDDLRNGSPTVVIEGGRGEINRSDFIMGFEPPESRRLFIRAAEARHGRRANIGFADAHVETLKFKTLFLDYSDAAMRRWHHDHQPHRSSN